MPAQLRLKLRTARSSLAGARITLRHLATGESRDAAANERGAFNVPILRIGDYALTAGAQGFKTQTILPITVRVDDRAKRNQLHTERRCGSGA